MTHEIDHSIDIDALARQLANGLDLDALRERQGGKLATGSIPPLAETVPLTKRGRAHLASLKGERSPKPPPSRDLTNAMSFEVAKRKVWALFEMRAAHISQIEDRDFNWIFSEDDLYIIRNLIRYFTNDKECDWPLHKGLLLFGMAGTGKTEIMQIFERFTRENNLPKQFQLTSMSDVYVKAKSDKQFDPITPNIQLDRCLDEFLRYVGSVTSFGESIDINEAIIEGRYPRFRNGGQVTYLISNATTSEMKAALSEIVFDRIRQMCTSVYFKGESKR